MSIGDSLSELLNEKALQLVELDGKSITQLLGVYCNNSIVSLSIIPYICLYFINPTLFFEGQHETKTLNMSPTLVYTISVHQKNN